MGEQEQRVEFETRIGAKELMDFEEKCIQSLKVYL